MPRIPISNASLTNYGTLTDRKRFNYSGPVPDIFHDDVKKARQEVWDSLLELYEKRAQEECEEDFAVDELEKVAPRLRTTTFALPALLQTELGTQKRSKKKRRVSRKQVKAEEGRKYMRSQLDSRVLANRSIHLTLPHDNEMLGDMGVLILHSESQKVESVHENQNSSILCNVESDDEEFEIFPKSWLYNSGMIVYNLTATVLKSNS